MNISETSRPIRIKFHREHHWDRGLAALGFRATSDQTSGFHGNRKLS